MIGILLLGHARIASETRIAVEHILGEQVQLQAVDIVHSDASGGEESGLSMAQIGRASCRERV